MGRAARQVSGACWAMVLAMAVPSWALEPFEDPCALCETVEHHEVPAIPWAERGARARLRTRFARAFRAADARLGAGGWTGTEAEPFWAGSSRDAPVFEAADPEQDIRLVVRPLGCAVYWLDGASDADELARVHGHLEIRLELDGVSATAEVHNPNLFFSPRVWRQEPITRQSMFVASVSGPLVEALKARLSAMPPGPPRLLLLERAKALLYPADMKRLAEAFEPVEAERHLVEYGRARSFGVEDQTVIIGTMPMSVSLDGTPQPVEPLPMSEPSSGDRFGRVRISGEGVARLSIHTPVHALDDVILTYAPGSLADFSADLFEMTRPEGERCVFLPVASEGCGGSFPPHAPADPHDTSCVADFHRRFMQLGELQIASQSGPRTLHFVLLRPGAIVLDELGAPPAFRATDQPCRAPP